MLSSIQQGIQSGHAAMELVNKYYDNQNPTYVVDEHNWEVVLDWIQNDKTIVCLNGGNSESMFEWEKFLNTYENPFPWVSFHEDESSMEGILTSIALILPARIYDVDLEELYSMASFVPGQFTAWEWELVNRVKSTSLAR
jgi:hypothetical protein